MVSSNDVTCKFSHKIRRHFCVKRFCSGHLKQIRQPDFEIFPLLPQPRWNFQQTLILVDTLYDLVALLKTKIESLYNSKSYMLVANIFDLEIYLHSFTVILQTFELRSMNSFVVGTFLSTPPGFFPTTVPG